MEVSSRQRFLFPDDPALHQFDKTLTSTARYTECGAVIMCWNTPLVFVLLLWLGTDASFLGSLSAVSEFTVRWASTNFLLQSVSVSRKQVSGMWSLGYKTFSTGFSKSAKQGDPVHVALVVFRERTEYLSESIYILLHSAICKRQYVQS